MTNRNVTIGNATIAGVMLGVVPASGSLRLR
jgi:hypothetical protein